MLIVFDDMIENLGSNIKISTVVTKLIFRGTKLDISLVFISQFYFKVPQNIRLNAVIFYQENS